MDISEALKSSHELEAWMGRGLHEAPVPGTDNVRMAYALLDLVQEHHRAIALLIERKQAGSAFTLLRPTFETLVRATWLARSAGAEGVERFKADNPPSIGDQLKALQSTEFGPWFLELKNFGWSAMCSYAHGGQFHVVRRISEEAVESLYESAAQVQVLRMAGFLALIAALQCGSISNLQEFSTEAAERLKSWYDEFTGRELDPSGELK